MDFFIAPIIGASYNAPKFGTSKNWKGETMVGENSDFSNPQVPVVVRGADGVRLVLGTHDYDNLEKPAIQIERRPNGWTIFLHPLGGSDASGYVCFLDDGRSFLIPELEGATEKIQVIDYFEDVPELDMPATDFYLKMKADEIPELPVPECDKKTGAVRRFRFEIGASVGFLVEAETETEANEKAKSLSKQLFDAKPNFDFPSENNVYLAVEESAPDFMEEEE
jgi:hypothetical protein